MKVICLLMIGFCTVGLALACAWKEKGDQTMKTGKNIYSKGRLTARPTRSATKNDITTGVQSLNLDGKKDGLLYIPNTYQAKRPAALAVMLHGAGGNPQHGLSLLKHYADTYNIILLAPASRAQSWDLIASDSFGPDVLYIDKALKLVFEQYAIDTMHMAIGGFSDGASYALSLGLTNGDLFTHILAFSPGFVHTIETTGTPSIYISHGTQDEVLPINPCSRRIVPALQRKGFQVKYQEFEGKHEIPATISKSGVDWFLKER
jgi:predicted esterase